jgi:hypothetical protein
MPFTPSHAVVALPFVRTPLVPAAIAVGAMTPDLPLFVRGFGLQYTLTHDLRWLPLTLLIALALLLVWRCVLRPAVRELSPQWLAARLPPRWDGPARAALRETFPSGRGVLLLVISLALGVASHVLWDLFTHEGRWGTRILPFLDAQWGPMTGYKWLQHGSSAIGLAILAVWAILWLRKRSAASPVVRVLPAAVRWAWWLSLPVVMVVAWALGLAAYGPLTDEWTPAHLAYRVLPPACAVWGLLTVVLCLTIAGFRARRLRAVR